MHSLYRQYTLSTRLFKGLSAKSMSMFNFENPYERRKSIFKKTNSIDKDYYDIMKEFEKEAEGVPSGSIKYTRLRNKYYKKLMLKYDDSIASKFLETGGSMTEQLRFYFIFVPEQVECFYLINILNYNKILFKGFEDSILNKSILGDFLGYEYRKTYKTFSYPFIQMESSYENDHFKTDGLPKIIEFLIENKFIKEYRTFSAYEQAGVEYSKRLNEYFEEQFLLFRNKFSFYNKATIFPECEYVYGEGTTYLYTRRLLSKYKNLFYFFTLDFIKYITKVKTLGNKPKSIEKLKVLLNEWVERLNNNPFHGGDVPDDADFQVFSLLNKYSNCNRINIFLREASSLKFSDWSAKMNLLCKRYTNPFNKSEFAYVLKTINLNDKEGDLQKDAKIKKDFSDYDTPGDEDSAILKKENKGSSVVDEYTGAFLGKRKRKKFNI